MLLSDTCHCVSFCRKLACTIESRQAYQYAWLFFLCLIPWFSTSSFLLKTSRRLWKYTSAWISPRDFDLMWMKPRHKHLGKKPQVISICTQHWETTDATKSMSMNYSQWTLNIFLSFLFESMTNWILFHKVLTWIVLYESWVVWKLVKEMII